MKKAITTILTVGLLLLYGNGTFAQSNLTVKDQESNKPLAGASIANLSSDQVLVSSEDGSVSVTDDMAGDMLRISYVGYKTKDYLMNHGKNTVYLEQDYQQLNDLTVVGYQNERKLSEIAGAYAVDSKLTMEGFNDESLVRSMNTLPGIRFEERSPASYRVSIRGSLLRAPYGVRNVKVYWNDIPYTDPSGNTPLNLMDLNNIGRVEIIKGPAGSIYGAGMGGVLNMYSEPGKASLLSANTGVTAGSYGYHKAVANLNTGNENHRFSMKYANQNGDGYRDHTNFARETIQMGGSFYTSEKRTLTAQLMYSDLYYQTPGGLTKAQYEENPRQARPGAAAKKSSIDQQMFLAGLVQEYAWNKQIKNTTSIFMTSGIKENPFINNYELEKLNSYGGRTSFQLNSQLGNMPARFTMGAELNHGNFHASNHGNVDGYADTLRYEDVIKSWQAFAFLQADMNLSKKWLLNFGASLNYLSYDIHRLRDVALDTAYQIDRNFHPELIPRVGLVGKLNDEVSVHASVSSGFSPPTTEEVRTSDGGINENLQAEKGINYEIGMRGDLGKEKFYYDVTAFYMQQKETIVSKTNASGTAVFENSGSTDQLGAELLLGYIFLKNPSKSITLLKIQTAFTHHDFTFKDYQKLSGSENVDYSGNDLTGTSPNISVTTLTLETRAGLYVNLSYNFTDKIPLNDANTVYADSYQLVTAKVGWKMKIKAKHLVDVFFGVDNLLDETYSLGNDLNAFGGRYFNASPGRNYFGGLKIFINEL